MVRITLLACFLAALTLTGAMAADQIHTKLLPHSVNYPLIRPVPYSSRTADVYEMSFGVRRMFKGYSNEDYERTLVQSINQHQAYGGYGVLGHGEDVFTNRAARYRRTHRGK
jgi:hypothetical protein